MDKGHILRLLCGDYASYSPQSQAYYPHTMRRIGNVFPAFDPYFKRCALWHDCPILIFVAISDDGAVMLEDHGRRIPHLGGGAILLLSLRIEIRPKRVTHGVVRPLGDSGSLGDVLQVFPENILIG